MALEPAADFRSLSARTADKAGREFFRQLVKHLALSLDVRCAFLAEFAGSPARVRTLALWDDGDWRPDVEYELATTPCQDVVHGELCLYPDGIQQRFPEDRMLVTMGARSYLGVPLRDAAGTTLGHLAVIDSKPMPEDPRVIELFRAFADRARVEHERLQASSALERNLRFAHDELEVLLEINRAARFLRRDELFNALASSLRAVVACERIGIELAVDGESLEAHVLTSPGNAADRTKVERLPSAGTACHWVEHNRERIVAGSREELRERFPVTFQVMQREAMESLCAVPLVAGDRCRGVLFFMAARREAFAELSRRLVAQVAGAVAIALDNCLAHEEVQRLRDRLEAENLYLQEEIRIEHQFEEIVGASPPLHGALRRVEQVAATDTTVLILGETGTGKELFARAIHSRSTRADRALVKVNCGAIPAGLVESELFGHVKGAFTGALQKRVGRFELADGGTIFLDEVGELPLDMQVKLLRVLQDQEFEPVGSSRTQRVDVRIVAATNRHLADCVKQGRFRADLLYRLNVFPVAIPPLRERRADIPLLVGFFLTRLTRKLGKPLAGFNRRSMERMLAYSWPGNVRELQNVVERAAILASDATLDLEESLLGGGAALEAEHTLEDVERRHIAEVVASTGGRIDGPRGAATILGLHPNTLRSRMKKLGIARASHDPS